jgi:hypothetical protein
MQPDRITVVVTGNPIGENGGTIPELQEDGDVEVVTSTGIQCGGRDDDNDNDNNDSNNDQNDNTNNDSTDTTDTTDTSDTTVDDTVDVTQDTAETTTAQDTTGADSLLDADANRPEADAFRCDFFLRAVRDDTGALRDQYQGNEPIVQRFEQCLSEDVLADTIPDRKLPFTGGMPLLGLAAIGLAAIVAGSSVLRAVTRRGG